MVVENAVDRHTMVAAGKSKNIDIIYMPTIVPDPPQAGGVKAVRENVNRRSRRTTGIAVGKVTKKKKKPDSDKAESGRDEQGHWQQLDYVEGLGGAGTGPNFVMKHKANSMVVNTSKPNEVSYVDSGVSNHMISHEEFFSYLEKLEQPRVVETKPVTTPIMIWHGMALKGLEPMTLCHMGLKSYQ